MSETVTVVTTIDKDLLFGLMTKHVELSEKGNELVFRSAFAESDEEARKIDAEHLDVASELGNLGFQIANLLMTDELRAEFVAAYREKEGAK